MKEAVELEFLQHFGEIPIEVAAEHQRILGLQSKQHLAATGHMFTDSTVEVIEHSCMKAFHLQRGAVPIALRHEPFHLYTQLFVERLAERIRRQDDCILSQLLFGKDICLSELLPIDRDMLAFVSVPDKLTPMATVGVKGTAEIENIAFHARPDDYLFSIFARSLRHRRSWLWCI